jgi:hypothetical protein
MSDAPTTTRRRWSTRRRIVVFLLLAVALSWWTWPLTLLNPTSTALVPVGPSVVALIVAAVAVGRDEVTTLLFPLFSGPDYTRLWWLLVVLTTLCAVAVVRLDPVFRRP